MFSVCWISLLVTVCVVIEAFLHTRSPSCPKKMAKDRYPGRDISQKVCGDTSSGWTPCLHRLSESEVLAEGFTRFFSSINLPRAGLLFCLFVLNPIKQAQQPVARSFTELHTVRRNIFFLPPLNQPSARFSSYPLIFPYLGEYSDQDLLIYHFYGIQYRYPQLSPAWSLLSLPHYILAAHLWTLPCILYPLGDGMYHKCIQH